jgi:hypothetical protein
MPDCGMVWFNSYTPPHFGRGRLQAEAVVRRRASKAVLWSPGLTLVWYGMVPLLPPVSVFCH